MNILYLGSHSVLEYDQVKLWTQMGHSVFSIGAYSDPQNPEDDKRPAIPEAEFHSGFLQKCRDQRDAHDAPGWYVDWAKADLHPDLIDWAEVIICDCYPVQWIAAQWNRLSHKRVIWRTIGQSHPEIEDAMKRLRGLEIVRYSPREKRAYERLGAFAGEDAVIRFGKDPQEWSGWTGDWGVRDVNGSPVVGDGGVPFVGNLTQHNPEPHTRDEWTNWRAFETATKGLAVCVAGPNSEYIGGLGALPYDMMRTYLRGIRVFAYTGTYPASYTLGLIEAMMTGVPVVAIPWPNRDQYWHDLSEVDDILPRGVWDSGVTRINLGLFLQSQKMAATHGAEMRERAIDLFGIDTTASQWGEVLGRVRVEA